MWNFSTQDKPTAIAKKTLAEAITGDAIALNDLGNFYFKGIEGLLRDEGKALVLYTLAAKKNVKNAQYMLFYYGLQKDARLNLCKRQVVKFNHPCSSSSSLSWQVDNGTSISSSSSSLSWQVGSGTSINSDTTSFLQKDKLSTPAKDMSLSLSKDKSGPNLLEIIKKAGQNDAHAQFWLGIYYHKGQHGLAPNREAARILFEQAATQNHASAEFYLSMYHEKGLGGLKPDLAKANNYLILSAVHGELDAIFHYSLRLLNGSPGIPKNPEAALGHLQELSTLPNLPLNIEQHLKKMNIIGSSTSSKEIRR